MKIGRPDAWWNGKVPIVRISVIVGVVVCGFYGWVIYGDLISSVAWGIRHQRMASFRGQTLQVPWLWREEKWANYDEFQLSRSYGALALGPTVTVRYENSGPDDVQKEGEQRQRGVRADSSATRLFLWRLRWWRLHQGALCVSGERSNKLRRLLFAGWAMDG